MERTVSATEARIHFGELMRQVVEAKRPVIVERGGKPQVVVLSFADYQRLQADQRRQPTWQGLLAHAHALTRSELKDRVLPPVDEIIERMREERDAELTGVR
ncbi:MAG: type II toxin-antitoxin system Phd/YefM family antitoxin [Chloroflexi bacterium]|nr:type II toxin-antitoxin system Phd/YefM family antitoxin [Chloroflexota bacterium]